MGLRCYSTSTIWALDTTTSPVNLQYQQKIKLSCCSGGCSVTEYETLASSGKAKCFPIHIVPAYLQMGGKLNDIAIAIPTRHPVSIYRCQYYLFDCGSREINARPEARDQKCYPNYAIVTRLNDIKVLDNSKRQDGCRYISNVNYDIVKQFLS